MKRSRPTAFFLLDALLVVNLAATTPALGSISNPAYKLLNQRSTANQSNFYVYFDKDSGFNHGFPSGFFANPLSNLASIHTDTGCVDDPKATNGCSTDPTSLDQKRGTVFRISFDRQPSGAFAGVNIEEPENWGVLQTGNGYNLTGDHEGRVLRTIAGRYAERGTVVPEYYCTNSAAPGISVQSKAPVRNPTTRVSAPELRDSHYSSSVSGYMASDTPGGTLPFSRRQAVV